MTFIHIVNEDLDESCLGLGGNVLFFLGASVKNLLGFKLSSRTLGLHRHLLQSPASIPSHHPLHIHVISLQFFHVEFFW